MPPTKHNFQTHSREKRAAQNEGLKSKGGQRRQLSTASPTGTSIKMRYFQPRKYTNSYSNSNTKKNALVWWYAMMMTMMLVLSSIRCCFANVAYPGIWTGRQPNGQTTGTEQLLIGVPEYHYAVVETDQSFYPTTRSHDGYLQFAALGQDGRYIPTNVAVGSMDPDKTPLQDALQEHRHVIHAQCWEQDYCKWKQQRRQEQQKPIISPTVTSGTIMNLVIPFQFSNHKDSRAPMPIQDLSDQLFNGNHLSVKDYFLQQSYGQLTVESEILQTYLSIEYTEQQCADHQSGLSVAMHTCLLAVLDEAAKAIPNFAQTMAAAQAVTFVHSGYAAEFGANDHDGTWYEDRIWSHAWELKTNQGGQLLKYALISDKYDRKNEHLNRVGVAVHELAQVLGAPTMYGEFPGYGLGYYDMMASPWGFDGTLTYCGSLSAYTKSLFGWVEFVEITEDGVYELEHSFESNKVYKIQRGFPDGEYLLIENRQEEGYDNGLSQPGIAIFHIDEQGNDVGGHPGTRHFPKDHYKAALVQGDGRYDLERKEDEGDSGDLFHAGRFTGVGPDGVFLADGSLAGRGGYPNTNSYQGGTERPTGITISEITVPDVVMSFRVQFS
jgi:M6 family metalloprotease-like protein